jgi:hypothetical protein
MVMKSLSILLSTMIISLATSTGAHAAATQKVYSSGILVLAFLGFCALVVVIQLIPAIITLYGMIKSAASSRNTESVKVTAN